MTLCVHNGCTSISHLRCLADKFLQGEKSTSMVPRGGECPGCQEWTLWGDLVRGCYRRKTGAVGAVAKEAEELSEDEEGRSSSESESDLGMGRLSLAPSDEEPPSPAKKQKTTPKKKAAPKPQSPVASPRRGRPPKSPSTAAPGRPKPKPTTKPRAPKRLPKTLAHNSDSESSELIDITGVR